MSTSFDPGIEATANSTSRPWPKPLLVLLGLFLLPLLLAALLAVSGSMSLTFTNKGEWIESPARLPAALHNGHWQLIYQHSGSCLQSCQENIDTLKRVKASLGRKQQALEIAVISDALRPLQLNNDIQWHQSNSAVLPSPHAGGVLIADPNGLAILQYQQNNPQSLGAALLKDLRKLLKYAAMD